MGKVLQWANGLYTHEELTARFEEEIRFWCNLDVLVSLVEAGGGVRGRTGGGDTALHVATHRGEVDALTFFLPHVPVDAVSDDGMTPLLCACSRGHTDVMRVLLDAGVRVDVANNEGTTPLHFASGRGDCAMMRALLDTGDADVMRVDHRRRTPMFRACEGNHVDAIVLLLGEGALLTKECEGMLRTVPNAVREAQQKANDRFRFMAGARRDCARVLLHHGRLELEATREERGGRPRVVLMRGLGGEFLIRDTLNLAADVVRIGLHLGRDMPIDPCLRFLNFNPRDLYYQLSTARVTRLIALAEEEERARRRPVSVPARSRPPPARTYDARRRQRPRPVQRGRARWM